MGGVDLYRQKGIIFCLKTVGALLGRPYVSTPVTTDYCNGGREGTVHAQSLNGGEHSFLRCLDEPSVQCIPDPR